MGQFDLSPIYRIPGAPSINKDLSGSLSKSGPLHFGPEKKKFSLKLSPENYLGS